MKERMTLLIVEDDKGTRAAYELLLAPKYKLTFAASCKEAFQKLESDEYDVVLLDVELPDGNGLDILKKIRSEKPSQDLIMASGVNEAKYIVESIKLGAGDFITKPIDKEGLYRTLDKIQNTKQLQWEKTVLLQKVRDAETEQYGIIGQSVGMQHICETIQKLRGTSTPVLLTGESGVGKEVIARAIHKQEENPIRPFIAVNCAAIPENLLESELFGHEKGAFTGANQSRQGKFVQADGGDIFLDEIACMSPVLQAKLLRVLQDKVIEPLGSQKTIRSNFRVIAATNHDIHAEIKKGKFREDLYYRLQGMEIYIPPLRSRPEDVPLLVEHILRQLKSQFGTRHFTKDAIAVFMKYNWPGNVRELKNTIENILILNRDEVLTARHLPPTLKSSESGRDENLLVHLRSNIKTYERDIIVSALKRNRGNKSRACKELGISRSILYRKMKLLDLDVREYFN